MQFTGMVLPNDRLAVTLQHVGMKYGKKLVNISVKNENQDIVMAGTAEVEQPTTVHFI